MNIRKSSIYKIVQLSFLSVLLFTGNLLPAKAQPIFPPEKPLLVVSIVVEQMRYDYIDRYWNKFGDGGFRRLVWEGSSCTNANYNYMLTQSAPGHATLATGTQPANHGIVANQWFNRLSGEFVYCVTDDQVHATGSNSRNGKYSPKNLPVSNLADELKLSNLQRSKAYSVSLKPESAILGAGHLADAAFWLDVKTGDWITSSYYAQSLPNWVNDLNSKKFADLYLDREWTTLLPMDQYTESLPDKNAYEDGFYGSGTTFPYDLRIIKKTADDYSPLLYTPWGNTYTKDLALTAILSEEMGKDEFPDFINISFSATSFVAEKFGTLAVETEDIYLRLDKDIEHLLTFLDEEIGKQNVLVYLTSDQGAMHSKQYLIDEGMPGGYFRQGAAIALLDSYLKAIYGRGEWIQKYTEHQLYLNQHLIEDSKLSLSEVQIRVADFLVQFTGVANALPAVTLQSTSFEGGIFEKMQNSHSQKRSGDILLNLEPGWVQLTESSRHNSAYTYDTHVPLIWYGWKMGREKLTQDIDIIDVAPTVCDFLQINKPNASTGKPIQGLAE